MKTPQVTDVEIARFVAEQLEGRCYDDGYRYWYRATVTSDWKRGRTRYDAVLGPVEQMRSLLPADPYWNRGVLRLSNTASLYAIISLARFWLPNERPE